MPKRLVNPLLSEGEAKNLKEACDHPYLTPSYRPPKIGLRPASQGSSSHEQNRRAPRRATAEQRESTNHPALG